MVTVMRKTKCGAHGAHRAHGTGGARYPPIYKQVSLVRHLITDINNSSVPFNNPSSNSISISLLTTATPASTF